MGLHTSERANGCDPMKNAATSASKRFTGETVCHSAEGDSKTFAAKNHIDWRVTGLVR